MKSIKGRITVKITKNTTLERMLKKFGKKVDEEGILTNLRNRRFFKKPCVRKAEKSAKARQRARRLAMY